MRIRLLVPVAMLLLAGSAGAQIPSLTLFGGAVKPTGDSGDGLNTGFTVGAALDMHLMPATPFGARLEGSYSHFGIPALGGTGLSDNASDIGVNLNAVMTVANAKILKPYLTAGPSYSNLKQGSESASHFGFNAGGGIDFGIGPIGTRLDLRYKYIKVDGGSWTSIPLTLGIRF